MQEKSERERHKPRNHQEKPGDAEVVRRPLRREKELMAEVIHEKPARKSQPDREQPRRDEDRARVRKPLEPPFGGLTGIVKKYLGENAEVNALKAERRQRETEQHPVQREHDRPDPDGPEREGRSEE